MVVVLINIILHMKKHSKSYKVHVLSVASVTASALDFHYNCCLYL